MRDVSIVPITAEYLAQAGNWATRDAAKTLFKLPVAAMTRDSYGWAAVWGQDVLAIATVELNEEHIGYLSCIVNPTETRHGVGSQIIGYVLNQPEIQALVHLHALVDPANTAAQKILDSQGFSRVGYGSDGRLEFSKH